jgi:uncharacterized protein with PhoU and TrkA domain
MDDSTDVSYEPIGVKQVLAEMKDTAEVLVDLSYSAVLFDDPDIAREVLELEAHMDVLQLRARMSLLLAARNPGDAEALAPVLGVVGAAEKISDGAGDIAKVVLDEQAVTLALRAALPEALETLVTATVASDSPLAETTLGRANVETETGVRVVAVRRDDEWLLDPDAGTTLRAGDVALLRGAESAIADLYTDVTGAAYERATPGASPGEALDRAVDAVVHLKDMGELAVDLAYGAVLYESEGVADAVLGLEAEVDALQERFEVWVLQAAADSDDPASLRGLLQVARGTETISDAALEISEGVLRGIGTHPVVSEAVAESDEVIVRVTVADGARLHGTTLGGAEVGTETGMHVVAIKRGDSGGTSTGDDRADTDGEWIVSPGPDTAISAGDALLAKGTRSGSERLNVLAGADE